MLSRLQVITPPAQLPVDINFARRHLRSAQNSDDDLLSLYLATAVEQAEAYLNRTLMATTYLWTMADTYPEQGGRLAATPLIIVPIAIAFNGVGLWNRTLEIPRGPVQSVLSVTTGNWDGTPDNIGVQSTPGATQDYDLDLASDPPRIRFNQPLNFGANSHLSITYTAGYATVPSSIIHAILLATASGFERRGDDEFFIPSGFYRLLDQHRLKSFPAA